MDENRVQRYREAENRLWQHYGIQPQEYFLSLAQPKVRVRIQEVGEGEPLLFVHGGPNGAARMTRLETPR